jgi:hypothetical protein
LTRAVGFDEQSVSHRCLMRQATRSAPACRRCHVRYGIPTSALTIR